MDNMDAENHMVIGPLPGEDRIIAEWEERYVK